MMSPGTQKRSQTHSDRLLESGLSGELAILDRTKRDFKAAGRCSPSIVFEKVESKRLYDQLG